MNRRKIECFQEQTRQSNDSMENIDFEATNHSSSHQYLAIQPSNLQDFNVGHFHQSPASGYYTTESLSGFPPFDCQAVNNQSFSMQCSKPYESAYQSYRSPNGQGFSVDQSEPRSALQSLLKSQLNTNQYFKPSDQKSCKLTCSEFQIDPINNLPAGSYSVSFEGRQDPREFGGTYGSPVTHLSFSSQFQQNKSPRFSAGGSVSNAAVLSSKARIRWTQDLHEKFVECVNRLGGAEKATPKAILKLMDSEGLTIFHVKSHLQKYRIAKYMPESADGKSEKKTYAKELPQLDSKTGLQIKEALQLQLDVQRRLHEQLEIQRNLQLRIEEQGRQLKKMLDQQQRTKESLLMTQRAEDGARRSDDSSFFTLEAIEGLIAESSGNTLFQPMIS